MESLTPGGHRRRRSSLINPSSSNSTTPRPHARSPRSSRASLIMNHATSATATGGARQGRTTISEEDGDNDAFGSGNDSVAAKTGRSRRQKGAEPGRATRPGFGGDGSADLDDGSDEDADEDDRDDHDDYDGDPLTDQDLHIDEETGLTAKERAKRKRRRRRNTHLDQRLVQGGSGAGRLTARDRRSGTGAGQEPTKGVVRSLAINAILIGLWYFFSLSISLYNKWMFDDSQLNFPFPLFTTSLHMAVQFVLSLTVLYFFPSLRPQHAHRRSLPRFGSGAEKPLMTNMFYITRIGPCGAATSLDIGLGNTSLKYITLTFYTMCKSSSLAFVLLFAFLFRLEIPTWRLVAVIATMTFGVLMMVAGEVEFRLGGFLLVISAAFFSGFRWALTQILLLRNPATSNPFSSIFFLSPVMFLTLLLIAVPSEGVGPLLDGILALADDKGWLMTPALLIFPGIIAFLMTASEFALLKRTSVVTLSIAGIFKEAVTISAAALVFGDTMTFVNVLGLVTTLIAIGAYNYIKISKMQREAEAEAQGKKGNPPGSGARREEGFRLVPAEDEDADADADADEDDREGGSGRYSQKNRRQEEGVIDGLRVSSSAISSFSSHSPSGTDAEGSGSGRGGGSSRGRGGGASSGEEARALLAPSAARVKGKERMDVARTQLNQPSTLFTADGDTVPRPETPSGLLGMDGGVALGGKSD